MQMRGVGGLSDVLRGKEDIASAVATCIRSSGINGLDVLSGGPRSIDSAELLAGPRFSELLAWAENTYDQVLIDSPPALVASDAAIMGRLVNGVVLVVHPSKIVAAR